MSSPNLIHKITFNLKGFSRSPFLYLGFAAVFLFGIAAFFSYRPSSKSFAANDIQRIEVKSQNLFLGEIQNLGAESPDLSLMQKNTLAGFCPPVMVTPQILGAIMGEDLPESRKYIVEYEVQPGDSLLKIANDFGISLNTLLWANNLSSSSVIILGKKLTILPVSGVVHHVVAGETVSQITRKYKADIGEIVSFNELSGEADIFIGDILVIPDGIMPSTKPTYSEIPLASSYFILPTKGRISQGLHWYNAIDFANECGSPIYAAAAGEVLKVRYGYNNGAGNYMTILHPNGVVTMYGHISASLVNAGDQVSQGQIIALIGGKPGTPGAGKSTGCHLHFGVQGARNPFAQ